MIVELISALNTILSVLRSPKVIDPALPLPALNVISPSTVKLPLTVVFLCNVIDSEPFVVAKVIYEFVASLIVKAEALLSIIAILVATADKVISPPLTVRSPSVTTSPLVVATLNLVTGVPAPSLIKKS